MPEDGKLITGNRVYLVIEYKHNQEAIKPEEFFGEDSYFYDGDDYDLGTHITSDYFFVKPERAEFFKEKLMRLGYTVHI